MNPARPRIVARSVAWPIPVKARLPCSDPLTPEHSKGAARILSRKRAAATIGPIVCDDDGPIPTLNISKTDRNTDNLLNWRISALVAFIALGTCAQCDTCGQKCSFLTDKVSMARRECPQRQISAADKHGAFAIVG